jgi:hypothetical protein
MKGDLEANGVSRVKVLAGHGEDHVSKLVYPNKMQEFDLFDCR